jgi:hypothetical protein
MSWDCSNQKGYAKTKLIFNNNNNNNNNSNNQGKKKKIPTEISR